MKHGAAAPFSPATRAARWSQILITAAVALAVAGIAVSAWKMADPGGATPEDQLDVRTLLDALVTLLQLLVLLGGATIFLTWFYKAHRNLSALGSTKLEFTPGWAVGGFFVPFLNLVRPVQVMREVWYCSDPSALERDSAPDAITIRKTLRNPAVIGWWWAFFLLSSFFGNAAGRIEMSGNRFPEMVQFGSVLSMISDVLYVPAGILAVRIIRNITTWQEERYARIQQGGLSLAAWAGQAPPIN